jgi:hypothetical protein
MALVLYAGEIWGGVNLVEITGKPWNPGPGTWGNVTTKHFIYDAGRARMQVGSGGLCIAYNTVVVGHDDQRIELEVVSEQVSILARFNQTTKDDYYEAHWADGVVYLFLVLGGTSIPLGNTSVVSVPSDTFALEAIGDQIVVYWNGVAVITVTNGVLTSGTVGIKTSKSNRFFGPLLVYVEETTITTAAPTTPAPTTTAPTTSAPTTVAPTTPVPTTPAPTSPEPTFPPTTPAPTTQAPTSPYQPTLAPTTPAPTTPAPSTQPAITIPPITEGTEIDVDVSYLESEDMLVVRSWIENVDGRPRSDALEIEACRLTLWSEHAKHLVVEAVVDEFGPYIARFAIPQARLWSQHLYLVEVSLIVADTEVRRMYALPVN